MEEQEQQGQQDQPQESQEPQQNVAPSPGTPAPDTSPPEQQSPQGDKPPVDDPDLPAEGDDPSQFEQEPVQNAGTGEEAGEERDDPNDLSGVDREFDDEEDE